LAKLEAGSDIIGERCVIDESESVNLGVFRGRFREKARICFKHPVSAILNCCDVRGLARLPGDCCAEPKVAFPLAERMPDWNPVWKLPVHLNKAQEFERNRFIVVMIRLARFGARKQPYYRIVVIEKDRARNGRSIEVVGTYNPRTNPASVDLKHERISYWRSKGAQLSSRMEKIVANHPVTAAAEPVAEATA
jgi:small subunit ribosomal protein S16